MAEIESTSYSESPKRLIAFMDIDPTIYESRQFKGKSKLSKRGNKHLRRIIWLIAHKIVRFNSVFKKYFQKRLSQGLPFKKAIFAVAHKLVRVIYALLTKRVLFNPTHCL
ncbi:MAG: IS110 family transposase [Candidatus Desulfofervidaceae bacterium]|nr:IS110 family transposase [Candidatus Desulfofervidaceae bacterium]